MALYTFSKTVEGSSFYPAKFTYTVELDYYIQPSLPDEYIVTCKHYFKFDRNIRYNDGNYSVDFGSAMKYRGEFGGTGYDEESWTWDSTKVGILQDLYRTTTHFIHKSQDGVGRGTFSAWLSTLDENFEPLTITIDAQDVYFGIAHSSPEISEADNIVLGDPCSITFTPNDINHYYKLTFSADDWQLTTDFIKPGTETAYTYNESIINDRDWFLNTYLPDSVSGQVNVSMDAYVIYDPTETSRYVKINTNPSVSTFDVFVPENIVPTVGPITLTPQQITGLSQDSYLLVQHKNSVEIAVTDCQPGLGSSIVSYTYSGPGISHTTTAESAISNIVSNDGELTYTVTVTDSRGRTTTATQNITCYTYITPRLSFSAYRSNEDGVEDSGGNYITCEYTPKYSSVNDTNTVDVEIFYKKNSSTNVDSVVVLSGEKADGAYTKILDCIDVSATYSVYAVIKDYYGGRSSSSIMAVLSAARIMNLLADGTGVAFGKIAETSNLLDSAWPINTSEPEQTMKNFTYRNANLVANTDTEPNNDTPKKWGSHGNLATTLYNTANQIADQPSDNGFVVNITNGPNASDVHQLWAGQSGGSLSHRDGDSSGWNGSWKTILDSENYTGYVNNDYINTISISWDKIVDTPTTLDGYGIVVENIDYIAKPVVLYDSSVGTGGTITLSTDSFANYEYLEIYYRVSLGELGGSLACNKFIFKEGSLVLIDTIDSGGSNGLVVSHISTYIVSEKAITPDINAIWNYKTCARTDNGSNIRIFRILGYK